MSYIFRVMYSKYVCKRSLVVMFRKGWRICWRRGKRGCSNLHGLLAQFSAWKDDRNVQRQGFDDEAEQGMFRTYHVLVHLTDYGVPAKKVGTLIHPGSVIDARQLNDHIYRTLVQINLL